SAQAALVGVEVFNNDVHLIDVVTGVTTRVGTVTGPSSFLGSIGRAPDGSGYGLSTGAAATLFRIDPDTWVATEIAPFPGGSFEGGIAISPAGDAWLAYGGDASAPDLYAADLVTGNATRIGTLTGGPHDINGLAYRGDGMLVGLDRITNAIVVIDPSNANLTVLATLVDTVGATGGMTVDGGVGYFATAGTTLGFPGSNSLYRFDPFTGASTLIAAFSGDIGGFGFSGLSGQRSGTLGTKYCQPNPNSTGVAAEIFAFGSRLASSNDVLLRAASLPPSSFGFFLVSRTQGLVQNPGGSPGVLCLSGSIGRYVGPGQVQSSGSAGEIGLQLDLTRTPTPTGFVSVMAGEDWNYQAWYRDSVGGAPTSNFSDGLEIVFL
ncbi:MAG: hypothetical protein AAF726_21685, partial [Planctomycetota bacterium]